MRKGFMQSDSAPSMAPPPNPVVEDANDPQDDSKDDGMEHIDEFISGLNPDELEYLVEAAEQKLGGEPEDKSDQSVDLNKLDE